MQHGAVRSFFTGIDARKLVETMNTVREAYAASEAARATGKEFVVSFICDRHGHLYGGEPLAYAIRAVAALAPAASPVTGLSRHRTEAMCQGGEPQAQHQVWSLPPPQPRLTARTGNCVAHWAFGASSSSSSRPHRPWA